MQHAWLNARLTAYAPTKAREFPKLEDLAHKPEGEKPRQDADQQIAVMRSVFAARKR